MKIFNYHPVTGEYISESVADESPLEPGKYLIPAHSTTIAPPIVSANEAAVFVDGWQIVPDFRGQTAYDTETRQPNLVSELGSVPAGKTLIAPPEYPTKWESGSWVADLSLIHAAAWETVKVQRMERDKQPIEIKGKLVDFADADDREKLRTAREALETATELGQSVSEFEWTCADNSTVMLGLADFKMIPLLAAIRSDANHRKSRAIKDLIYAAETPEAVDAILNDPELWGD